MYSEYPFSVPFCSEGRPPLLDCHSQCPQSHIQVVSQREVHLKLPSILRLAKSVSTDMSVSVPLYDKVFEDDMRYERSVFFHKRMRLPEQAIPEGLGAGAASLMWRESVHV